MSIDHGIPVVRPDQDSLAVSLVNGPMAWRRWAETRTVQALELGGMALEVAGGIAIATLDVIRDSSAAQLGSVADQGRVAIEFLTKPDEDKTVNNADW